MEVATAPAASGEARRRSHPFPWIDASISDPFYFLHLLAFFSYFAARSAASSADDGGELHSRLLRRIQAVLAFLGLFAVKVINEETFAILVLMALVTTFITTPTVMALYKPARTAGRRLHHRKLHGPSAPSSPTASSSGAAAKELRVLACIHGGQDVPALINLIETIRGHTQPRRPVKLYILRLVELTERTSSILMVRAARRNGVPFLRPQGGGPHDQIDVAFDTYAQLRRAARSAEGRPQASGAARRGEGR